jgi:hypothetical protein
VKGVWPPAPGSTLSRGTDSSGLSTGSCPQRPVSSVLTDRLDSGGPEAAVRAVYRCFPLPQRFDLRGRRTPARRSGSPTRCRRRCPEWSARERSVRTQQRPVSSVVARRLVIGGRRPPLVPLSGVSRTNGPFAHVGRPELSVLSSSVETGGPPDARKSSCTAGCVAAGQRAAAERGATVIRNALSRANTPDLRPIASRTFVTDAGRVDVAADHQTGLHPPTTRSRASGSPCSTPSPRRTRPRLTGHTAAARTNGPFAHASGQNRRWPPVAW